MSIEQYKKCLQNAHCLVIGDLMLDEYISGDISRISPEAPVPIVNMHEYKYVLGGAANVAANLKAFGVQATLIGVIGNNYETDIFKGLFLGKNINFNGIISKKRISTIKTRVMAKNHQLFRIDKEQTTDIDNNDEGLLMAEIKKAVEYADVIILSDYCKGVCTERVCQYTIKLAAKLNKIVIVDSKRADWSRYKHAALITPNFNELKEITGHALKNKPVEIASAARALISDCSIKNVLVTRSHEGMMLINDVDVYDFKAEALEVYDVSGAGDTVAAATAAFLSIGVDIQEAVKIANAAAGIAVSKVGTYAVTFDDLALKLNGFKKQKLMLEENAIDMVNQYKQQGKKIVFTNGCFDILHIGHIILLSKAKQLGDILVVGLNSDESVRNLKGDGRPVNNENDRAYMLSALESVDIVVIFGEETPYDLVKGIMPDYMVKGSDYSIEAIAGHDIVIDNGGQVIVFPLVEGKSTSNIIQSIRRSV